LKGFRVVLMIDTEASSFASFEWMRRGWVRDAVFDHGRLVFHGDLTVNDRPGSSISPIDSFFHSDNF
jgi:hypothetical protein